MDDNQLKNDSQLENQYDNMMDLNDCESDFKVIYDEFINLSEKLNNYYTNIIAFFNENVYNEKNEEKDKALEDTSLLKEKYNPHKLLTEKEKNVQNTSEAKETNAEQNINLNLKEEVNEVNHLKSFFNKRETQKFIKDSDRNIVKSFLKGDMSHINHLYTLKQDIRNHIQEEKRLAIKEALENDLLPLQSNPKMFQGIGSVIPVENKNIF